MRIVSRNLLSLHQIEGFWGWLLTFNILNRIHNMTAIAAKRAVDMMAKERPKWASKTNTSPVQILTTTERMTASWLTIIKHRTYAKFRSKVRSSVDFNVYFAHARSWIWIAERHLSKLLFLSWFLTFCLLLSLDYTLN